MFPPNPFDIIAAVQSVFSVAQGAVNTGLGTVSSLQSTMGSIQGVLNGAIGMMNQALTQVGNLLNKLKFLQVIGFIVIIGKCFFKFLTFIIQFILWTVDFIKWIFVPWPNNLMNAAKRDSKQKAGFLPWLIRFVMTAIYKIVHFPKCFLWYVLDTAGWIIYLPFRFIFWLFDFILNIGLVKAEHDVWCFLDDIDYFLHGPKDNEFLEDFANSSELMAMTTDPDSMNTGYHLIHFPDQVMRTCYKVNNFSLASLKTFPMKYFLDFISCATQPF